MSPRLISQVLEAGLRLTKETVVVSKSFLMSVCYEEAMKTMQSMGDLDSTETLHLVSSKLPSYSGVK